MCDICMQKGFDYKNTLVKQLRICIKELYPAHQKDTNYCFDILCSYEAIENKPNLF